MKILTRWDKVKARVSRSCMGLTRAPDCGKTINKGDIFYKCNKRNGLTTAEICQECADKNSLAY